MPDQDLLALLAPLTFALRAAETDAAAAAELTMWQYAVLVTARDGEYNQLELARTLRYDKNRIIGDLDRLVERGLARREPDPRDRRSNLVRVTGAGAALATEVSGRIRRAEERLLAALDVGQRARLRELLALAADSVRIAGDARADDAPAGDAAG